MFAVWTKSSSKRFHRAIAVQKQKKRDSHASQFQVQINQFVAEHTKRKGPL